MKPDQDWTSVWPAAHTFKWSVVPFPVRQGFIEVSVHGLVFLKYLIFLIRGASDVLDMVFCLIHYIDGSLDDTVNY